MVIVSVMAKVSESEVVAVLRVVMVSVMAKVSEREAVTSFDVVS